MFYLLVDGNPIMTRFTPSDLMEAYFIITGKFGTKGVCIRRSFCDARPSRRADLARSYLYLFF